MNQNEINKIFDTVSVNYDKINNFISLGLHLRIKKSAIGMLNLKENAKGVDLCTGTGDLIKITKILYPTCNIIGIDSSEKMLKIAKEKNPGNEFIKAEVTKLPYQDNKFDFITMAFGLRNIIDRNSALKELYRVLNNEGVFLHLDFGKHNFLNRIFNVFVPILVKLIGGDKNSYKYLISSKNNFPEPDTLIKKFESYGFKLIKKKDFLFGSVSAQLLKKI